MANLEHSYGYWVDQIDRSRLSTFGFRDGAFDSWQPCRFQTRRALLHTAVTILYSIAFPDSANEFQGKSFRQFIHSYCPRAFKSHRHDDFTYWCELLRTAAPKFYYKVTTWPASIR